MLPVSAEQTGFPFARSIIKAQTDHLHQPGSEPTVRYLISSLSLDEASPQRFAQLTRGHWNIENGSHWRRDTLWREDGHLMRQHRGAHILSSLRQLALCLHSLQGRNNTKTTLRIKHCTQKIAYNLTDAIKIITYPLRE